MRNVRAASGGGREDAKKSTMDRGGTGAEARPFFDPKRGRLGANFSGGTGPRGPLEFLHGETVCQLRRRLRETDANTCLLLIYRRPIRFPSINVTDCNCVLVADR